MAQDWGFGERSYARFPNMLPIKLVSGKSPRKNWIGVGGYFGKKLRALTEQHPFICHGLSLSIGGPTPIDQAFTKIKKIPTSTQYPLLQRTFELLQR